MYTKKYIDVITLALVIIIFILINIYHFQTQSNIEKVINQSNYIEVTSEENLNKSSNLNETNEIIIEETYVEEISDIEKIPVAEPIDELFNEELYPKEWYLKIPTIDLVAPIQQGTTTQILNKTIGHFEESPLLNGNVCLAAHNRGYEVNFFEKIKNLLLKDIIIYQYGDIEKTYAVSNITIIKETDWSYVEENTNQNKITLITCVENKPEYRLCVQATEI